ncbi:MAG: dihydroorotate dehydrogenase (quinone) [Candidatus Doudnabacteria bacterium RIFCSPHIGHO2_02_FULL_46_11]|uniref:Dihydroorotate dehydrogenase (quinone) n=1 Tax=Candidatus Doudnabacteria bacterium RIFCSPHIGHO2_02_FULL_46_11 TaxID=1817832 RepID=A0A1F5P9F0_9BACT|nr:MAG: dihydroorotate dehydrogenase (quinone) [Candidatus Doudnabacteria bacterium RIFCSPHIGHO2_02_FULL_46_11]
MTETGVMLGKFRLGQSLTKAMFRFSHPALEQTVAGIKFNNPIGLAAGFDKNGLLTQILPAVGFGFEEIGSATGEPCSGNLGKRLWRLKDSQSLLVYYGLKNDGCEVIANRLENLAYDFPIGISLAKTNNRETVDESKGIADYLKAYLTFSKQNIGDYFTLNISCPNTFGGEPFTEPNRLDRLLAAIRENDLHTRKPIFLKLPAELHFNLVDEIIELAVKYRLAGFICTNLAKNRANPKIKDQNFPAVGGMSGKVVQELSDNLISYIYKKCGQEFVIIGCGGIFTADDAYKKIKKGATLLQMITGMVFEGPQVVSEINWGLVKLLQKDGYTHISKAIGTGIL